jgi:hypothetical protein
MHLDCFECAATVEADELTELGERFLAHARTEHEWPYPDQGIRNFAEATQRLTGSAARLPALGEVTIHPVTEDRLDDWAAFFDHDAFVGNPEWAACYCLEPRLAWRACTCSSSDPTDAASASMRARRRPCLSRAGPSVVVGKRNRCRSSMDRWRVSAPNWSLRACTSQRGGRPVLTDLTLAVSRGMRLGIVGENGRGSRRCCTCCPVRCSRIGARSSGSAASGSPSRRSSWTPTARSAG